MVGNSLWLYTIIIQILKKEKRHFNKKLAKELKQDQGLSLLIK